MSDLVYILDTNNNGYIDYTEFIAGCLRSKIYLNEDNLKIAFSYFDQDNSGYITKDEIRKVLGGRQDEGGLGIPEGDIERLIKDVDFNHDEKVDYAEFLEMMRRDLKGDAVHEAVKRQATSGSQASRGGASAGGGAGKALPEETKRAGKPQ